MPSAIKYIIRNERRGIPIINRDGNIFDLGARIGEPRNTYLVFFYKGTSQLVGTVARYPVEMVSICALKKLDRRPKMT